MYPNIEKMNEKAKSEYFLKRSVLKTVVKCGEKSEIFKKHMEELSFEKGTQPSTPYYFENEILKWDNRFPKSVVIKDKKFFTRTYMEFLKVTKEQRTVALMNTLKYQDRVYKSVSEHSKCINPRNKQVRSGKTNIWRTVSKPTYKVSQSEYRKCSTSEYLTPNCTETVESVRTENTNINYWSKSVRYKNTTANSQRYYDIIMVENETFHDTMNSFRGRKKKDVNVKRVLIKNKFMTLKEVYSTVARWNKKLGTETVHIGWRVSEMDTETVSNVNKYERPSAGMNGFGTIVIRDYDNTPVRVNGQIRTLGSDSEHKFNELEWASVTKQNNPEFESIVDVLDVNSYDRILDEQDAENEQKERNVYLTRARMKKYRSKKMEQKIDNIMLEIYLHMENIK